jgi:uncharacterized glyoxalase superfamily protein PhnB
MATDGTEATGAGGAPDRERPPQVWPSLRARDARALIRFLVDAFGFEENVVYGEGAVVHHAELDWPEGGGVMLGSVRESEDDGFDLPPGSFGAYVVTDRLDEVYRRAKAAGARITAEPHTTDYGSYDFAAVDPEGNRWNFGTYRGAPRKSHRPRPTTITHTA